MNDPRLAKRMFKAAKSGDVAQLRELARMDPALVQARDAEEATPLHHAAWKGQPDAVLALLELGANVNAQSRNSHYGGTPLHAAAHANQRDAAQRLINAGADIQAVSCNGRTPLEETEIHGARAVATLLRQAR